MLYIKAEAEAAAEPNLGHETSTATTPFKNEQDWINLIVRYEKSGLTHRSFCEKHLVNISRFRYWLYKIKKSKSLSEDLKQLPDRTVVRHTDVGKATLQKQLEDISLEVIKLKATFSNIQQDVTELRAQLHELRVYADDSNTKFVTHKDIEEIVEDYLAESATIEQNNARLNEIHEAQINEYFSRKEDADAGRNEIVDATYEALESRLSHIIAETVADAATELESKLYEDVKVLEGKLSEMTEPSILAGLQEKIISAQEMGMDLMNTEVTFPFSPKELVAQLRQRDFFISESLASEILHKLATRKLVVFKGVPGTGKSQLAKHLADLLLPSGHHPNYTQHNVFPEATTWHSIGGLRMIGQHFAPHLGWLSEAAIKSIEANGNHWLILDEINRGDISALLAPVLDALTPSVPGFIEHPNLFPQRTHQSGRIPVPGSFRILGTMNPYDADVLFSFTHAFNRRIGFVHVPPMLDEDEQSFLDALAVQRQMEAMGLPREDLIKFKRDYNLERALNRVFQTAASMRTLITREPRHLYLHCEIGTAVVLETARRVCILCTENPKRANSDSDTIVDQAFHDTVLSRLDDFSRQALTVMSNEVFGSDWAPRCFGRISTELRER